MTSLQRATEAAVGRYRGLAPVFGRALAYSVALAAVLVVSATWLGDTYTANLALFGLFSFLFELYWTGARRCALALLVCCLLVACSGLVLLRQAQLCRPGHHHPQPGAKP